jgi:hypothetical protein
VGVVATGIVIAIAVVAVAQFEIDIVQNDSQEPVVDAAGRTLARNRLLRNQAILSDKR